MEGKREGDEQWQGGLSEEGEGVVELGGRENPAGSRGRRNLGSRRSEGR